MSGKIIKSGNLSQKGIIDGVNKSADAIKTTMGPAGKCVAISGMTGPEVTRDGATVAKFLSFSDQSENMGAQLVRKAASLTEEQAGDGTSSTSLLIQELCARGQKALNTGSNVNELKVGMNKATTWVKDYITKNAIPISDDLEKIRKVATISANNDPEVGDLVVECMSKVGIDGVITADVTSGLDTYTDVTLGMKLERGWSSPQYVTSPEDGKCTLDRPIVLVIGEVISSVQQLVPALEILMNQCSGRPFLIICDDMTENVNMTLISNTLHGACRCCVVKGIDFGDGRRNIMEDIATSVGATHFCQENGVSVTEIKLEDLGGADKVIISRDNTIIYNGLGDGDKIQARAEVLKSRMKDPSISDYDKVKFSKRVAGLTGGVGIIYAGGASETEKMNKKATIDDSILAAKSALEEGCAPGGGYVFYKASLDIIKDKSFWKGLTESEKEGAMIVVNSLPCVMNTVITNSGSKADVVMHEMSKKKTTEPWGFNAKTKKFGYLLEEGILDSAKVLRVSLENSVSTASMILLIDCVVLEEEDPTPLTLS